MACGRRARALLPLALALVLGTAFRAALAQVSITTAIYTGASQISVTLSNSTQSSGDCKAAFALYNADNTTKGGASPFANCTASGTSALLFLSNGVTYAGGDKINIRVNQTVLRDAANDSAVPAALAVVVQPLLTSATLTAPGVISVKLPFAVANGLTMNASVCAATFELRAAGAAAAKPAPFAACSFSTDTARLTLTSPSLLASGDTVNIVDGQTSLLYGTAPYARSASGLAIAPTITSVSLTSATTVTIGTAAPVAPLADTSAAACNAIFDVRLANTTTLAAPFGSCSVSADAQSVVATFATNVSFAGGMTINVKANQTTLKAFSAAGAAFVPLAARLTIQPTVLAATLTSATTVHVTLPVASTAGTLDQAACNAIFELRGVGLAAAKASPFASCTLAGNGLSMTLTLASATTYKAGDVLNVQSGQTQLVVGSTAYVPRAVPVLPTLSGAFLVSASTVHVTLPVPSALPAAFTPADCARTLIILPVNVTSASAAKAIASCAIDVQDSTVLTVTLAAGASFAAGDTINVVANQWQLRGGRTVTVGPTYVPAPRTLVTIIPAFTSAALTSATSIAVKLPVASALAAGDCNTAFSLIPFGGGSGDAKSDNPIASCRLDATNTTLNLNLTAASSYAVGDIISAAPANSRLTVGTLAYGYMPVAVHPILTAATTAVLTAPDTLWVTLPYASYLPANMNASDCNAAFELKSASGSPKPAAFSDCSITSATVDAVTTFYLSLTLASESTYAAGDLFNVKDGNALFRGLSSAGPLYVPAAAGTTIAPTIVAAALPDATSLYVTLSAPAKALANSSVCEAMVVVAGKTGLFANCTLSADARAITFVLNTANALATGDTINVKASQDVLLAAGSAAADSPAFVARSTAVTITKAELSQAFLTSATTIVARLSVPAAAAASFASGCNTVFSLAMDNGTARVDPFASCSLSADGTDVTLEMSSSVYAAGDTLNVLFDQGLLFVLNTASGPKYGNLTNAVTIAPAITSATAIGPSTFVLPLPVASDLTSGACSSAFSIVSAVAPGTSKTVTGCSTASNGTVLTVTVSGGNSGGAADASYAAGDTITITLSNSALRVGGVAYAPMDPVPIHPSFGDAIVTGVSTISVALPTTSYSTPDPLTAAACEAALGIFSSTGDSPNSGAVAGCEVDGSTLTVTLSGTYNAGDRINVLPGQVNLTVGSGANEDEYVPLSAPATIKPAIISAKASSASTLIVTLPVASTFLAANGNTTRASLDQADCANVLSTNAGTLNATRACNLNYTTSASFRTIKVTLAADSYTPGNSINVVEPAADVATLRAGSTKSGPAYYPATSAIVIDPAYVVSAVASTPSTIVVTLPVSSSLYDGDGDSVDSPISGALCAEILDVKGKNIASCDLSGTELTVNLFGNGTDVYAAGDTFSFKDTNTLLRAGASSSSLAYKAHVDAQVINPQIVSAELITSTVIRVTFSAAVSSFLTSPSATPINTLTADQCADVIEFTSTRDLKAGAGACVISGNIMNITLVDENEFVAGDGLAIVQDQTILRAGSDGKGAAFVPGSSSVGISVAFLTSAIARDYDTIEVTLPYAANVGGDGTAVSISGEDCSAMVEVLALGAVDQPRVIDSCVLETPVLTITLETDNGTFAAGDTVRIKQGNAGLKVGASGSNAPFTPAARATVASAGWILSAVAKSDRMVVISLPVNCTINKASFSAADCGTVLTLGGSPTIAGCSLSGSTLTVNFTTGAYAVGTTDVQIQSSQTLLVIGTSASGAAFAPLTSAVKVVPGYLTAAVATDVDTVQVTLPYASAFTDTGNCDDYVRVMMVNGSARAVDSCTFSTPTITINLDEELAAGDYVAIVANQGGITTSTGSLEYAAATMDVSPGFFSSAVAVADDTLLIKLPFASELGAGAACSDVVYVTASDGTTVKSGSCTIALDTTKRFLKVVLAADLVSNYKYRVGASPSKLTASGVPYTQGAALASISATAYPTQTSLTVTAVTSTQLEVQLPTASVLSGSCSSAIDIATPATTISSCSIIGDNSDILVVNLASAYTDGATLKIKADNAALWAGSSSAAKYGETATIKIKPTLVAAYATAADAILVTLPIASTLFVAGGGASATDSDCTDIFALSTTGVTGVECANPSNTNTITLQLSGGTFAPGDTAQVANTAGNPNSLQASNVNTGQLFVERRAEVTITPTLSYAKLIAPLTILAGLPVASTLVSSADCNTVFALYASGSSNARTTAPFTSCVVAADGLSVTLTLRTTGSGFLANDKLNILTTQKFLYAENSADATKRMLYGKHPSGVTVLPTLMSAVATSSTNIYVQLPMQSFTTTATWSCTSATVAVYPEGSNIAKAAAASNACTLKGNVLVFTLLGTGSDIFEDGDTIDVLGSVALWGDQASGTMRYTSRAVPVYNLITADSYPDSLVSATLVATDTVEVALPTMGHIVGSGVACTDYLTYSKITACAFDTPKQIIRATLGSAFAATDSINVVTSQDKLKYLTDGTSTNATASWPALGTAIPVRPTVVSAYTVDSETIAVVLPTAASLISAGALATSNELDSTDCAGVLAWASLNGGTTRTAACSMTAAGSTTLTMTLDSGAYAAGDTVNVLSTNIDDGAASPTPSDIYLAAGSSYNAANNKFGPRRLPVVISPRIVSALAVSATSIQVTLPADSAVFDSAGSAIDRDLTKAECDTIVQVNAGAKALAATTATTAACSVEDSVLTVNLASAFAPGDNINIVSGNTLLRAGTFSAGPVYTPSASAVAIAVGFFTSAVALDASTILVTLPFPSAVYTASTQETSPFSKAVCDSLIRVSNARTLDTTDPCELDETGTKLTITLASANYAARDKIDFADASTGTSVLRAAPEAANIADDSTPYTQVEASISSYALTISPTVVSAEASGPATVVLTLSATAYAADADGAEDDELTAAECASIVTFNPAKTLSSAADACSYSGTTLTVKLAGAGASGTFAAGDKVNIASANAAATVKQLQGGNSGSGPAFVPAPTDVTVRPNLYTATAVSSTVIHVGLPAASSFKTAAPDADQCKAIVAGLSSKTLAAENPCVLDTDKTTLIISYEAGTSAYADGETLNIQAADPADGEPLLTAGTDGTGPVYIEGASVAIKPTVVSAKAVSERVIEVTLPADSGFWTGGAFDELLTGDECSETIVIKRADGTVRDIASCSLPAASATTLVVTLASDEAFAAGDSINVAAKNTDAEEPATKPLVARNSGSNGQAFVPRAAAVTVAPGYVVAAFALTPSVIAVQLPVTSYMGSASTAETCAEVVEVKNSADEVKGLSGCEVAAFDGVYALMVELADGVVFAEGDTVSVKDTNAASSVALLGGASASGKAYEATDVVVVRGNLGWAVLPEPDTIVISLPAAVSGSVSTKSACDRALEFGSATNRTSPVLACSLTNDNMWLVVDVDPTNPFMPGDWVNVREGQTVLRVLDGGSPASALVQSPVRTVLRPQPWGASATLVNPTTIAVPLPGPSTLVDGGAASCNEAIAITAVSGASASSPIASCSLAAGASAELPVLTLTLAAASYAAGDSLNIASPQQDALWLGAPPAAAPYWPADDGIPVLTTLSRAVLTDPTTVVVHLPTASAVPDGLSVDDCARALAVSSAAGELKNGTLASCTLSADRMALTLSLKDAASYTPSDKLNVRPGQAELRAAAMDVGTGYVPKAMAQPINPALWTAKPAVLSAPSTVSVTLAFPSALAAGSACPLVLQTAASGASKSVSSCSLGADGTTLTLTLAEGGRYEAGDVLQVASNLSALTLADGTTTYVPSAAGVAIAPVLMSAVLTGSGTVEVALPTASVVVASTSDACSAMVSITSAAGGVYSAPVASCAVDASGTTLTLTMAANYAVAAGDTLDVKDGQTNLRAGSASGPAYIQGAAPLTITLPSPPPPSPSPPPPPPPPAQNVSARGLSTGYVVCQVAVGANSAGYSNLDTANGSFTVQPSDRLNSAVYRAANCYDFVTGASFIEGTVASPVLYGMDAVSVTPIAALARTVLPAGVPFTNLSATITKMCAGMGLLVDKYTNLYKYDHYQNTFMVPSTPGAALTNVHGLVASNLKMYASWFDGLLVKDTSVDFTAAGALAGGQSVFGATLLSGNVDLTSNATILSFLRQTFALMVASSTTPAQRHLLQAGSFSAVEATAVALTQAVVDSNKLVQAQQDVLLRALATGQTLSQADLERIILASAQAIATQSTVLSAAAQGLANGTISVADFQARYTGDALAALVRSQQLNSGIGGTVGAPAAPSPPPSDDDKDNKPLIIGLVVGLVGGAIVIGAIVAFVVMRRRKQSVVAQKGGEQPRQEV